MIKSTLLSAAVIVAAAACGVANHGDAVDPVADESAPVVSAPGPATVLSGPTTFVVHHNTPAELDSVLSAVAQVQAAVPFTLRVVEAGPTPVEGDTWHVWFNAPCGLELSPTLDLCDAWYEAATSYARRSTWISAAVNDDRSIVAHEIGHAVGHREHAHDGVMATPSTGDEEFSDADLAAIRAAYR